MNDGDVVRQLRSFVAIGVVAITILCGAAMSAAAPVSAERDRRGCRETEGAASRSADRRRDRRRRFPGMIAIELTGGSVLYASADGRYLIAGDLYEIGDTLVNIAEQARDEKRKELIAGVSINGHGDISGARQTQGRHHRVHRRRLHVLPQAAPGSAADEPDGRRSAIPRVSARRCRFARLRQDGHGVVFERIGSDAITRMKRGEELPPKTCDNPVAQEYELGHLAGLTGTPAIVLEDGRMLGGLHQRRRTRRDARHLTRQ